MICRYCETATKTGDGKRSFPFDPSNRERNGYDWGKAPEGRAPAAAPWWWTAMRNAAVDRHMAVVRAFYGW